MYANNAGTGYTNANIFYLFLGAQQQWGFEETETKTIAFPISFESIKYVFLSKIYGPASGGADTVAYNFFRKSLTGVSFDYAYTRNWLAIGGQQPQWGKSTGQTTTFPISFTVSALNGFTQYNETGNATGNADQTITSLSKTSITTYRGYGYNYWVIGH